MQTTTETKATFTQTPWVIETVKTSCGICHKVGPFPRRAGQDNHACIYVDYPGSGPVEAELLANAKLIAAAPALFSALREMMASFPRQDTVGQVEAFAAAQAALLSAIA